MDISEVYKKIADRAVRTGNNNLAALFRNPKIRVPEPTEMFQETDTVLPSTSISPAPTRQEPPIYSRGNVLMDFMQEYARDMQVEQPVSTNPEEPQKMQIGGVAGQPQEEMAQAPMAEAPATIVGNPADGVTPEESIADDVPVDVPEGTFVINQPAVDAAGLKDLIKKIEDAYEVAEREGIDISADNTTMSKEDTVNLLVSKGELLVSPAIARIIGYETLEKINNRGAAEVERRQEVAQQEQQQPQNQQQSPLEGQLIKAARGGFITKSN